MKYEKINAQLFIENRARLVSRLKPNSLAVVQANDIMPTNADGHMPFKQNADLFHLTGVDQEESILVVFPDSFHAKHREILFLKETNEHIAVWEGAKLTKEQAKEATGIQTIYWLDKFDSVLMTLMSETEHVLLNANEHLRAHAEVETRGDRFIKNIKQSFPLHNYGRLAPIMHAIRSVKHPIEVDLSQKACNITDKGFRRILDFVKPGVWEFEIEAEFMHEFMINRSRGFAYQPIVASGASACVLHYIDNNQLCKEGDIILMDVGAEYANYASDMTRCIPVSGRFTARQKEVYNAVLRVKKAAEKLLIPGAMLHEYHVAVGHLMEKELVDLGLISLDDINNQDPEWPAYKQYFMHGTSHYLGLDVHDVGSWTKPIEEGMIFTCEPGIYIPEENLGIRIEDDLVVSAKGAPINLMGNIPIEVEEIEDLMNK